MFKSLFVFCCYYCCRCFNFILRTIFQDIKYEVHFVQYYSYSINDVQDFITFLKSGRFDIQGFSKTACRALSR